MQFKKTLLFVSLISIAITANAGLQTFNYTDEDSSVKVTSGKIKPCSISAGKFTPKRDAAGNPGVSTAKDNEIKLLCATTSGDACTADIYASRDCSGPVVGNASLSLKSTSVTNVTSTNPRYVFLSENSGTVLKVKYSS